MIFAPQRCERCEDWTRLGRGYRCPPCDGAYMEWQKRLLNKQGKMSPSMPRRRESTKPTATGPGK